MARTIGPRGGGKKKKKGRANSTISLKPPKKFFPRSTGEQFLEVELQKERKEGPA